MTSTLSAGLTMSTTTGHIVPTRFTYTTHQPLQVTFNALLPSRGLWERPIDRAGLMGVFHGRPLMKGAVKVSTAGALLVAVLVLDLDYYVLLRGDAAPVRAFVDETVEVCPPCAGCGSEFCLSCAKLRGQVAKALDALFETEGA